MKWREIVPVVGRLTLWLRVRISSVALLTLLSLWGSLTVGCVQRVLELRTDPPGVVAYINGEEVGTTPVDYYFSFYGTLDIELRHGPVADPETGEELGYAYRTEHIEKELPIPWYQHFPLDFFVEFFTPWPIVDRHELSVTMTRHPDPDNELDGIDEDAVAQQATALEKSLLPGTNSP